MFSSVVYLPCVVVFVWQCLELVLTSLDDISDKVVTMGQQMLLPVFALWAVELGRLETDLLITFIQRMDDLIQAAKAAQRFTGQ